MSIRVSLTLYDLSGTSIINGVAQDHCSMTLQLGLQHDHYSFLLFYPNGTNSLSVPRYVLTAELMDHIMNSPSVRLPAPNQEFVGHLERKRGDPREPEFEKHPLNELDFRLDNTCLNITGITCKPRPEHLSNWGFDITVMLNEEMIQLLRSVPPLKLILL